MHVSSIFYNAILFLFYSFYVEYILRIVDGAWLCCLLRGSIRKLFSWTRCWLLAFRNQFWILTWFIMCMITYIFALLNFRNFFKNIIITGYCFELVGYTMIFLMYLFLYLSCLFAILLLILLLLGFKCHFLYCPIWLLWHASLIGLKCNFI